LNFWGGTLKMGHCPDTRKRLVMAISKTEFLETVKKANVLSPEQLVQWSKHSSSDGVQIANQMVRDRALTEWQAKYLLTGRYQLELGNYRLLQRIQRDELGDRFLAVHKQLGRRVDIQVLAANLMNDAAHLKTFIDRVSRTSTLDHPNLGHVYDIDQAGGRYYLVTEHAAGKCLGEVSGEELSESTVVKWLQQVLSGLEHAHSNGTIHGDLTVDDFVIDEEHGIKIQNLAITDLRSHFRRDRAATFGDDLRAVSVLFGNLINRLSGSEPSPSRDELRAIVGELAKGSGIVSITRASQRLNEWLERFGSLSKEFEPELQLHGIEENVTHDSEEFVSTAPSSQNRLKAGSNGQKITEDEIEDHEHFPIQGRFSRMAVENPVGLLSTAFALGVLASAAVTYAMLGPLTSTKPPQLADASEKISESGNPPSRSATQASENPTSSHRSVAAEETKTGMLEPTAAAEIPLSAAPDEADIGTISSTITKVADETKQGDMFLLGNQSSDSRATLNDQRESELTKSELTKSELAKSELAKDSSPVPEPPATMSATPDRNSSQPEPETKQLLTPSGLTPEQFEKRTETPFNYFPKQVSLPDIEDHEPAKLGEVFISNRYLLGAEIITHAGISGSKVEFAAERDPSDNQRWLVGIGRTANDRKTPIAVIQRMEHEIFFEWLPEAKRNKQAGFLKNCLLKLFIPDQSLAVALRTPVEIEPLLLSSEKLSAETQFDLDFLPNTEHLLIEVVTVKIEDIRLSPSVIDLNMGNPGRVLLKREDNNPLVWVNLGLELKAKAKLRVDLVVFDSVRARPLKNLQELQKLANEWKQWELEWTQKHQIAEATPAQPGKSEEKRTLVSELSKRKNLAKTNATKLFDYVERAPKMMNQPYGIRILARYDGFEVELARTKLEN
jgi:serine/threonine protein kinase